MVKKSLLWLIPAILSMTAMSSLATEVYLDVIRSETQKIPLAIFDLADHTGLQKAKALVEEVLSADIKRSQVFEIVDLRRLGIDPVLKSNPEKSLLTRASTLGVEAIAWANLSWWGKELVLEGHLYDGSTGRMIIEKRYFGQETILRTMVHRFADEILFRYTGEKGIAHTRIAFVSDLAGNKEIYLMDYDGHSPRRITADSSVSLSPNWSPDGRWLSYTSYRDGNPDLYILDLESSRRWKFSSFEGLNISPSWSPQGDYLALSLTKDGNAEIYILSRDGKDLRRLTFDPAIDISPSWSPTGREMVFVSDRGGSPQLYIMGNDGTNVRRLTFEGDYNTSPTWSPKGEKIAYVSRREGRFKIFTISPDGSNNRQVTNGPGSDENPSWSPDGHYLAISSTRDGRANIYITSADGSYIERLTHNGANNTNPAWSP